MNEKYFLRSLANDNSSLILATRWYKGATRIVNLGKKLAGDGLAQPARLRLRGYFFTEYPTKAPKRDYLWSKSTNFSLLTGAFAVTLCLLPCIAVAPLCLKPLRLGENSRLARGGQQIELQENKETSK